MENLATALAQAQGKMKNATLNKVNPHFRSRYADLAAIRDAAIPALAEQGIALVQAIETREYGTVVVTKLLKGEEAITSECPVIVGEKCKPQEFGSALTYARRYSMAAIVGISADEDDDANAAEDSAKKNPAKTPSNNKGNGNGRKAPAKPEVPHVQVAQDADGNPDWQTFADTLKAEINKAPDVATVNELVKVHNGAISNLKNVAPDLCKVLEETTKLRRSDLAQARAAAE